MTSSPDRPAGCSVIFDGVGDADVEAIHRRASPLAPGPVGHAAISSSEPTNGSAWLACCAASAAGPLSRLTSATRSGHGIQAPESFHLACVAAGCPCPWALTAARMLLGAHRAHRPPQWPRKGSRLSKCSPQFVSSIELSPCICRCDSNSRHESSHRFAVDQQSTTDPCLKRDTDMR